MDGEYTYTLKEEAEDLLYEASLDSLNWVDVSADKRLGYKCVLNSKRKEVEA